MKRISAILAVTLLSHFSQSIFIHKGVAQAISSPVPITQLIVHNEGVPDVILGPGDGDFSAHANGLTQDGLVDFVSISFFGEPGEFWFLDFGTNQLGVNMVPGFYDKAERALFESPGHPGLDISGNGSGCNTVRGNFTILDATFDYSSSPPRVVSFAAQFEQRCEGGPRVTTGSIFFNHTPTSSLSLNPSTVNGGQPSQGVVALTSPAPMGGAVVELISGNTSLATVPANVFIPEGATSTTFPITTKIVKSPPSVVILAVYNGVASAATLKVISPIPSITQLVIHSENGDFIGGGQDYLYTKEDGDFIIRAGGFLSSGLVDTVSIFFLGNVSDSWFLDFSTRQLGVPLAPGTYINGQRYPFEDPGHPGLDISGNGRGCNMLTGKFTVLDATFDNSFSPPEVISFAVQFEQHCEGGSSVLTGTMYYNFTPPESLPGEFDICIQDESSGDTLKINSSNGEYRLNRCAGNLVISGRGDLAQKGNVITLQHYASDRRILAKIDRAASKGTASIQVFSQGLTLSILDRNIANNSCSCP